MKTMLLSVVAVFLLIQSAYCVSVLPAGDVYVASGSNAVLSCSTDRQQDVVWLKGDLGSQVATSVLNDSSIAANLSTLTIADFNYSRHGGFYSCSVEGPLDHRQLSCPTQLQHARIMANSTSQHVTRTVDVTENDTAVFECDVPPSWPPAHFRWEKDGESVHPEEDVRLWLMPSGNLYITGVTSQDQGRYTCSAINPVTMATRRSHVSYVLSVSEFPPNSTSTPTFTITPLNTVAIVGSQAVIECLGHAHPTPQLEWIIIHDTRFPEEGRVLTPGTLVFDPVVPEDAGTYRCRISNSVGTDIVDVTLEVQEPPVLISSPTHLPELPHDQHSNSTVLTCSASGTVPLELLLLHDGRVVASETVIDMTRESAAELTHTVTDEGFYQCFARNDAGCQEWTTFAVRGPPSTTASTTTTTEKPFNDTTTSPMATTTSPMATDDVTDSPLTTSTSDGETTTVMVNESSSIPSTEPSETTDPLTTEMYTRTTNYTQPSSTTEPSPQTTATPTTTPPSSLEIMTSGDMYAVRVGDQLAFECHVVGGGEGTQLSWVFEGEPLTDVKVELVEDINGRSRLVSQLSFDGVKASHAGEYTCMAHSPLLDQIITAPITLVVSNILHPPLNLTVMAAPQGGLLVSWLTNPANPEDIAGYKITWDIPSRVVQSALTAVPPSVKQYLITGVDPSLEYVVEVWAYTLQLGDGEPATIRWIPKSTVTTTMATVAMTTAETTTPPPVCVVMDTSPTEILLEWPEDVGVVNITASCQQSGTSSVVPVTMATNSYKLTKLLPACRYEVNVGVANCFVDTPPGPVDLEERVHHYDNGSIRLDWRLPRELRNNDELTIEIRVNDENWVRVHHHDNMPHLQTHLADGTVEKVDFRFQLREWEGVAMLFIPAREPSTSSGPAHTTTEGEGEITTTEGEGESGGSLLVSEVGVVYGVIFGLLVVACASVVIIILVLKYVQMSRRENDKVTTDRETQREEFRRLSLSRSSVKSLKKEPTNFYQPTQTDV